jgi:hypothetical protein
MKHLLGKGSLGYWLGGFAMTLPLLTLAIAIPSVNYVSVLIIWIISQVSFLESIRLLTKKYEARIKELESKL